MSCSLTLGDFHQGNLLAGIDQKNASPGYATRLNQVVRAQ